jgi:hypothetical protein
VFASRPFAYPLLVPRRSRAYLTIFAAGCLAAGLLVPFIPRDLGIDILAGVSIVGGLAMLIVALGGGRNGDI